MVLVAILLTAGIWLVAVQAVGYRRGGYNSEFWKLPLDDKLDHVAEHRWEWWWISIWELIGLFAMTGGVAGLTALLVEDGEPVLAAVGFGAYLVALFAWVLGSIVQAAAVSKAADERTEIGETPSWIHPFWQAGYFAEGAWIIGANLAYTALGTAIIQTSLVGVWAGWAAIGLGIAFSSLVLLTRTGFPQLGLIIPAIIGVALFIEAL